MEPIHIVGTGGIGCAVGYALRAAGARVTFVDTDAAKVAWGRAHGVRVDRRPSLPAEFETFQAWQPAAGRTVLLCTKSYDSAPVLARLPASIILIPIQNGFDRALDARGEFPEGIASFVSECFPHRTHTRITRGGRLHLGIHPAPGRRTVPGSPDEKVRALAALLKSAGLFRVEVVPDILPYKHTKLMYNAAIGPLAAAAGLDNGALLRWPHARRLFFALLRENYVILRAAGVALGKIGPFQPATVDRILRRPALAWALSWAFYPSLRGTYCSMHGDLPAGRTEVDFYNGYLIALAGDRPCPWNRRVYDLVKRMEREQIPPGPVVLDALLAGFSPGREVRAG